MTEWRKIKYFSDYQLITKAEPQIWLFLDKKGRFLKGASRSVLNPDGIKGYNYNCSGHRGGQNFFGFCVSPCRILS
jgi:hypothetical protein